ncbi:hypothetical protein AB0F88_39905 [Streptosporangium sp. NPDC023963]|uniref:hypothetical protein n=1 Tax=Streptosporangium sp. NPDC023963 TaxID=3155608 RepID=UPI00342F766B
MSEARRFQLVRDRDVTGVSGVGIVADGVLWPDNTVSIRWRGDRPSIVHWSHIDDALHVHGHGGATRFEWLDNGTTMTLIKPDLDQLREEGWVQNGRVVLMSMLNADDLSPEEAREFAAQYAAAADLAEQDGKTL